LLIAFDDNRTLLVSNLKTVCRRGSAAVCRRHTSSAERNQRLILICLYNRFDINAKGDGKLSRVKP